MSYRNKPYRDKDKRSLFLEKESKKLRQEISELEDALILHSRFEGERDQSLRGLIRKEVGGSHWEHGAEGKLRTYRTHQDLHDGTQTYSKRNGKETHQMKKCKQSDGKRRYSQKSACKTIVPKSLLNDSLKESTGSLPLKSEPLSREKKFNTNLDKSFTKVSDENQGKQSDSLNGDNVSLKINPQEANSLMDLKSRVLTKATAKILSRSGHGATASRQKKSSLDVQNTFQFPDKTVVMGNHKDDAEKVDTPSTVMSKDFCRKQEFGGQANKKICSEEKKSACHGRPLSKMSESKSVFHVQDKGFSSHLPQKDKDDKYNFIFAKTINDSSQSRAQTEDGTSFKAAPSQDKPFSQFSNGISSKINSQFDDFISSDQSTIDKSTFNSEKDTNWDIRQTGLDADSIKVKSPQLDNEVNTWLHNLGLHSTEHYVDLFAHHQMDMASIKLLTATQLREMGIHALGPIMKIMKGVQILGRRNSLDDGGSHGRTQENKSCGENKASSEAPEELKSSQMDSDTFHSLQMFKRHENDKTVKLSLQKEVETIATTSSDKCDKRPRNSLNEKKTKIQKQAASIMAPNERKAIQSAKAGWKKTFDEAEFLNLNNRSYVTSLDTLSVTSVNEKEGQTKHTSSQKKIKQTKNANAKTSRKPPQMASNCKAVNNGVTFAAQRYIEKQRLQQQKEQTDGGSTARRKVMRDEMAARHHVRRRSSSLDRSTSPSNHRPSLQRSSSFTGKVKKNVQEVPYGDFPEKVVKDDSDLLNVMEDIHGNDQERIEGQKADGMKQIDTVALLKDFPEDPKIQEDNKVLTLGVVRQLKKQLSDLEQHLVQTQDNSEAVNRACFEDKVNPILNVTAPRKEIFPEDKSHQMDGIKKDCDLETLQGRKSARERRRDKLGIKARENKESVHMDSPSVSLSFENHTAPLEKSVISSVKNKDSESGQARVTVVSQSETVFPFEEKLKLSTYSLPKRTLFKDSESHLHDVASSRQDLTQYEDGIKTHVKYSHNALKSQRLTKMSRPQLVDFEDRLRKIEIDYQDLSFEKKDILGEGVFSQVFKGSYQGSQVALKLLRAPLLSADKNYFSAEVSLLQELRHPHVVMLLGVCTSNPRPIMVLELMEGGNLFARLQNHSLPCLPKSEMYQISHDVASGVCYLHHHRPPVLHLDMKSRNVLLGLGNRAKVADFGFSKLKHEADIKISRASKPKALSGSPAWMAPELLSAGEITAKADVYSYAIVLWEMITREIPYDGLSMFQILEHVRLNCRPKMPSGYPQELTDLIIKCWEQNPAARPGFKDILKSLDTVFSTSEWIEGNDYLEFEEKDKNPLVITEYETESSKNRDLNSDRMNLDNAKDVNTYKWENIDVRSISSEDTENSECENKDDVERDVSEAKHKDDIDKNERNVHSSSNNGVEDIFYNKSQVKLIEVKQMPPNELHSRFPSMNEIANLPDISPRLVPSPRIREMAKKQAVEKSFSTLWSQSLDKNNEVTIKTVTPKQTAAFPHEDKELETLIKKYLPSPRNKSLIRGYQATDTEKVTERLLPLRQSLDRPRKPPKPTKMQSISQSLNFDHPVASLQRAVAKGSKLSPPSPQQSECDENNKDFLQPVGDEDIDVVKDKDMNQSADVTQKSLSLKSDSPLLRNPSPKSSTDSLPPQEDQQTENGSHITSSITTYNGDAHSMKHNNVIRAEGHEKIVLLPNVLDPENPVKSPLTSRGEDYPHSKVERDGVGVTENSFHYYQEIRDVNLSNDDVKIVNDAINIGPLTKSAISSDSKYAESRDMSLPFLSELQEKSAFLERENTSVDKKSLHSSENKETKCHRASDTKLCPESRKGSSQQHSDVSFQPSLDGTKENPHSDSESSICSEFSADSLSISFSDDVDSIGSLDDIGPKQKTRKMCRKNSKHNSKSVNGPLLKSETFKKGAVPLHVTQSFYEPELKGPGVRESFFLFDNFQLVADASGNTSQIWKLDRGNYALNASSYNSTKTNLDEGILNSSALGIVGRQMNPSSSNSELHNQENSSKDLRTGIKKGKSHFPKAKKEHPDTVLLSHGSQNFKRSHDAHSDLDEKQNNKNWPAPPLSKDEPEVRPLKNVQFSLEASMLIKQKRQLKSVAVQGQTAVLEITKTVKRSVPSVASILKKAIEERRFAMGDQLESQDITPEASWSIQDEDV